MNYYFPFILFLDCTLNRVTVASSTIDNPDVKCVHQQSHASFEMTANASFVLMTLFWIVIRHQEVVNNFRHENNKLSHDD